jgi:pimeloyl-ACP methyl ester carboxylesterase
MPGAVATPQTNYARSGDVHIAYQVAGDGPLDLVSIPSLSNHVELNWENPAVARFLTPVTALSRLIALDKRGTGMSDRVSTDTTLETRMDDIRTVMSAAGSDSAVVCAIGDMRRWGEPATQDQLLLAASPDMSEDDPRPFGRLIRFSVSPGALRDYMRMNLDVDVCAILPSIQVPTLVLHRDGVPTMDLRGGRCLAEHIPGARLVVLEGRNLAPAVGDLDSLIDELRRFLQDVAASREWNVGESERACSRPCSSPTSSARLRAPRSLGDRAWRDLLHSHHEVVRRELARFRGKEFDTAGDGFFASFDGPAQGIRCACAIAAAVKDLVAGSGIAFADRGATELKGVPGEWRLFAVEDGAA